MGFVFLVSFLFGFPLIASVWSLCSSVVFSALLLRYWLNSAGLVAPSQTLIAFFLQVTEKVKGETGEEVFCVFSGCRMCLSSRSTCSTPPG